MSVDESTVTFGPMDHVGWSNASSTVTVARSARVRPRNGPPEAVSTMRSTRSSLSLALRHWWMAQCSLSTGRSSAPGVDRTCWTTGPAAINDSLLARPNLRPAANTARVTGKPAKPTTPLMATSAATAASAIALGPASTVVPAGTAASTAEPNNGSAMATTSGSKTRACSTRRSTDRAAPRATTSNSSGRAATTSRV